MRRNRSARGIATAVLALVVLAVACTSESPRSSSGTTAPAGTSRTGGVTAAPFDGTYRATIRRTAGGVPHVVAANVESATFGQGWASAQDYACTLRDQILKIQGRRAEHLGAGENNANVASDFAWRTIGIDALARKDFATQSDELKAQMTAFTAGWNRSLEQTGADQVKGWCAGAAWLTPITAEDLYAYARSVALNASSTQLARYLGTATPPAATAAAASTTPPGNVAPLVLPGAVGSNGWAIGSERAEGRGGMLVANPHFPWEGELRFWEVHLTVPGEIDLYGVQLEGLPGVGIGFTRDFAWTHTVSAGNRFTAYTLDLVPGKPTSYRYDGGEKQMTSRDETVKVRQADGSMKDETRTLWFSEYGPILDFPGVGWSAAMTTTYRDANIDNDEFIEQYLAMDRAKTFEELQQAHETHQGVPLFNTIAVSRDGRAWYADTSATPNLSEEALRRYQASLDAGGIAKVAADSGAVLLDGSSSVFQWVDEPGARDPGLVPYARQPKMERLDYVFNANDSFWMSHGEVMLEGDYSPLHGRQRTARSPRTRENATVLDDTTAAGPSGEDGTFSLVELRDAALLNRGFTSRALKDAVVARCKGATLVAVPELLGSDNTVALPADSVDVAPACAALEAWDGRYDLTSRGAHVWRELMARFEPADLIGAGRLWAQPFDPASPVSTPGGLAAAPAGGDDPVLVNLARAVQVITKAGVAIDAELGDLQFAERNGTRVPIHGGNSADGATNIVGYSGSFGSSEPFPKRGATFAPRSGLTSDGYWINNGTSFLLAVELTADGPQAFSFLTYGNTGDRTSPVFVDETRRFSAKEWRPVLFTDAAIADDPALVETTVSNR